MLPKHLFHFERRDSKVKLAPPAHFTIVAVVLPACSFLLFWYRSWLQSRQDSAFSVADLALDSILSVAQLNRGLLQR